MPTNRPLRSHAERASHAPAGFESLALIHAGITHHRGVESPRAGKAYREVPAALRVNLDPTHKL
eukprot:356579-Chlamydomonas_euryale.AAC.3